ncbi:MAG: putative endonuclease [Gammaproteobacteria bacterium]|nr:MAG: putative endonuclease [Gammaproteobacteria bacterium]TND04470.1 MAG: putative endonuclease [Gammaproteobacteria bacterium]
MVKERRYFVYLLTNWSNEVMYVGMTNDIIRRVYEHKTKTVKGFTEKYNVHKLVYFEETSDVAAAIGREKEIKKWRREKKNALVMQTNPEWRDLGGEIGVPARHLEPPCHFEPCPERSEGSSEKSWRSEKS